MRKINPMVCVFVLFIASMILAQEEPILHPYSELESIDINNAANITMLEFDDAVEEITSSPDESMVAIARQSLDLDYTITIFSTETGEEIMSIQGRMDSFRSLVWSPDSRRLAVVSGRVTGSGVEEQTVKLYTIEAGTTYMLGNNDIAYVHYSDNPTTDSNTKVQVAWNPGGEMIAIGFSDGLYVYSVQDDSNLFFAPITSIRSIDWALAGKVIVVEDYQNNVSLWGIMSEN